MPSMIPPPGFIHCSFTSRPRRFASQQPASQARSLSVGFGDCAWAVTLSAMSRTASPGKIRFMFFVPLLVNTEVVFDGDRDRHGTAVLFRGHKLNPLGSGNRLLRQSVRQAAYGRNASDRTVSGEYHS